MKNEIDLECAGTESREKCFAQRKSGRCAALIGVCPGYDQCSFYKTEEEYWRTKEDARQKLCALSVSKQQYIAEKYHRGAMPWRGEVCG